MSRNYEFADFLELFGKICFFLAILLMLKSLVDDFLFRMKFYSPLVSAKAIAPIDTISDPIQIWDPSKYGQITVKSDSNKKNYILTKNAQYALSGMLVAKNTNFWFRGLNRNEFDEIALIDVGLIWGNLAQKDIVKNNFIFYSKKTLGSARKLYTEIKSSSKYSSGDLHGHYSHTHIVPATPNIMSAVLSAKKYDKIKLDGYLIDITQPSGSTVYTSDSRTDTNGASRGMHIPNSGGGGACEIMYVTSVQLNDKIYK